MGQQTRQILMERRKALESVTQKLIEIEVMDSDELAKLIDETLPGPRVMPGTSVNPTTAPIADEQAEKPEDDASTGSLDSDAAG